MNTTAQHKSMDPSGDPAFETFLEATKAEPIYVILGVQGSGTNLTGRFLKRFYRFSVVRDQSYLVQAASRLGPSPTADAVHREIRRFTALAFPSNVRRRTRRKISDYAKFEGVIAELRPDRIRSGADFVRIIHAYRAYSLGTTRMAVKSDDLWAHMESLDSALPNRRILLITRDFRDNLVSITGKHFGPIEPLAAARYVKARFAHYLGEYRRSGSRALHTKFETLVNDPRQFIADFGAAFGIAPVVEVDAALESFQIRPNRTQRWKKLPVNTLGWCESLLHDELVEFGYELAMPARMKPPQSAILAAAARDAVKRVPQKIRTAIWRIAGRTQGWNSGNRPGREI